MGKITGVDSSQLVEGYNDNQFVTVFIKDRRVVSRVVSGTSDIRYDIHLGNWQHKKRIEVGAVIYREDQVRWFVTRQNGKVKLEVENSR